MCGLMNIIQAYLQKTSTYQVIYNLNITQNNLFENPGQLNLIPCELYISS